MTKLSVFQIILLAVFGALAAAGILIFAFAVGGGKSASTVGTVVIWGTLDKSTFDGVLQQAIQENQDLSGVAYVQQDPSTYDQDLANALAEKKGPDLYVIASDDALQNAPKVTPIPYASVTQQKFKDAFASAADPFLGPDGIIAVPFLVDPLVLYWNRDLLAGAGYSQPPSLWSDVPQMAQKLTAKNESGEIQTSAVALGTFGNIEDAKSILAMLFMQAANNGADVPDPITTLDSQGKLTATLGSTFGQKSPPALDALKFYTEFADPGQSDYSWDSSFESARSAFSEGRVALYLGFASEGPLINKMNPNLNYSAAPVPQLAKSATRITFARAYAFAVPLAAANPAGAQMAAELLDTASTSAAFARAFGMAPASRLALFASAPGYQGFVNAQALIGRNWTDPDPRETDALFRDMIDSVVSGATAPVDALQQADQKLLHLTRQ